MVGSLVVSYFTRSFCSCLDMSPSLNLATAATALSGLMLSLPKTDNYSIVDLPSSSS